MTTKNEKESIEEEGGMRYIVAGLLSILVVLTIFQIYQLSALSAELKSDMASLAAVVNGIKPAEATATNSLSTASSGSSAELSSEPVDVIPKGIPDVYGAELGVSFDDVSASNAQKADETIRKLAVLDTQITLSGADFDRYVSIASQTACEYCCGAKTLVFTSDAGRYKTGDAACGCAHSYAMRGLAKYLIQNHGSEYTDDQILEELGKWKTLFFPGAITAKAKILQQNGIELNYINLASNKYRGIEQQSGSGSSMVGGC